MVYYKSECKSTKKKLNLPNSSVVFSIMFPLSFNYVPTILRLYTVCFSVVFRFFPKNNRKTNGIRLEYKWDMWRFITFLHRNEKLVVILHIQTRLHRLMKESSPKTMTLNALLDRARHYCALTEQCETSVRQKLIGWGAASSEVEEVIASLRADDYLNDKRFACCYVDVAYKQTYLVLSI